MAGELVPKKNHRILLKDLCNLINEYGKVKNLRDKSELADMLLIQVPKILNNFDKNHPEYPSIQSLTKDIIENLGIIIRLVKED